MGIRALRDDEDIPNTEPRRYRNAIGYVRLRWKFAKEEYVEAYEHRIVAGRPSNPLQVHHLNRIRDDNRPENLVVVTPSEHTRLHQQQDKPMVKVQAGPKVRTPGTEARAKKERARKRREYYRERAEEMRTYYEAGLSTTQIGFLFGLDAGNVSIHLRRIGTVMRPFSRAKQ